MRPEEDKGRKEAKWTKQTSQKKSGEADSRERRLLEPVDFGQVGQCEKMSQHS